MVLTIVGFEVDTDFILKKLGLETKERDTNFYHDYQSAVDFQPFECVLQGKTLDDDEFRNYQFKQYHKLCTFIKDPVSYQANTDFTKTILGIVISRVNINGILHIGKRFDNIQLDPVHDIELLKSHRLTICDKVFKGPVMLPEIKYFNITLQCECLDSECDFSHTSSSEDVFI